MNTYNTNGMGHYESNLRHMAEPADPSDRDEAVSTTLSDVQALYITEMLREWASYHAEEGRREIALGYVEWINKQVRENGNNSVTLYAHTTLAANTITDAIYDWYEARRDAAYADLFGTIEDCIIDLWGGQHAEEVNKDAGRKVYEEPPSEIEIEE